MSSIFSDCKLTLLSKKQSRQLIFVVFIDPIAPEEIGGMNGAVTAGIDLLHVKSPGLTRGERKEQEIASFSQQSNTFNMGEMGGEESCLDVQMVSIKAQGKRRGSGQRHTHYVPFAE